MAKLFYPETKKTKTAFSDLDEMDTKSPYNNVVSKKLQECKVPLTMIWQVIVYEKENSLTVTWGIYYLLKNCSMSMGKTNCSYNNVGNKCIREGKKLFVPR